MAKQRAQYLQRPSHMPTRGRGARAVLRCPGKRPRVAAESASGARAVARSKNRGEIDVDFPRPFSRPSCALGRRMQVYRSKYESLSTSPEQAVSPERRQREDKAMATKAKSTGTKKAAKKTGAKTMKASRSSTKKAPAKKR